jgi:UPF0755 protein
MSSGSGWPPGGTGAVGRGDPYADDEYSNDRGSPGRDHYSEADYDWSEPSGQARGDSGQYRRDQGDQAGRGYDTGGYGRGGYDQASYGRDSHGRDSYGHQASEQDDSQAWQYGGGYARDHHGPDEYDQGPGQGGYGRDGYGQSGYEQAGYEQRGYEQAGYEQRGYEQGGYEQGGYERDGRGQGSSYSRDDGQDGYHQDGYGQDGYGQGGYGQEAYGQPGYGGGYYDEASRDRDDYGRAGYQQDGPASESYGHDSYPQDGFRSGDGYGVAADSDVTSSYRPDSGSFTRHDSGWYDTGSFGRAEGYQRGEQEPYGQPSGGYRRAEFDTPGANGLGDDGVLFGSGPSSARSDGYDQWHDAADQGDQWRRGEPADHEDDWRDERVGGSLLSRRFSGASDSPGRRVKRARRQRRVRGKFAFTAAILAGALVLGAVADFGYERFRAWETNRYGNYTGSGYGQVRFNVPQNAALSVLGPALVKAGVIKALRPYDSAAASAQNASSLQPGIYLLHHHMNAALAVTWLLSSAHRINDQITLPEGLRASDIAYVLSKKTGLPISQFTQIISHPSASLGLPSWSKGKTAEGFLFPDTYQLLPNMTALHILQTMVTEFKRQVGNANLSAEAAKVYTSPWHALIVASLIQAEAGHDSDMPIISRIIWNRLLANMPLQLDSTVFYAMHKYGTAITQAEESYRSPYNTYAHTGLPPGPIDNPGMAAIQAAVHPSDAPGAHSWLYFITDTRKGHGNKLYYTSSLTTFQQWQQEFQG